ncbi:hypothetical protein DYB28_010296, partial [Aphanomyces astaci]
ATNMEAQADDSPVESPSSVVGKSNEPNTAKWVPNTVIHGLCDSVRGCSYYYSCSAVYDFLTTNHLMCMVRAHELQDEGYLFHFSSPAYAALDSRPDKDFPPVITVFSAANYCDTRLARRNSNEKHPMAISKALDAISSQWTAKHMAADHPTTTTTKAKGCDGSSSSEDGQARQLAVRDTISDKKAKRYLAALDCNHDGHVDLDDLLSCAAMLKARHDATLRYVAQISCGLCLSDMPVSL